MIPESEVQKNNLFEDGRPLGVKKTFNEFLFSNHVLIALGYHQNKVAVQEIAILTRLSNCIAEDTTEWNTTVPRIPSHGPCFLKHAFLIPPKPFLYSRAGTSLSIVFPNRKCVTGGRQLVR